MRILLIVNTLIWFLCIGCKVQDLMTHQGSNIFNHERFNREYEEIVSFNLLNEPGLLNVVKAFQVNNNNIELEDIVVLTFLEIQRCNNEAGPQFIDYPNELQPIFDFYKSMDQEEMEWFNKKELIILKFTSIRFILKNAGDHEAMEYLRSNLKACKDDQEYARFVMSSSSLNGCIRLVAVGRE